tara:strand:+ start:869 stop:1072 length:204 start_codon:yes stop_codon:yes gene_type:complete
VSIGKQRKNGKTFKKNSGNDWKGRKFHKKCHGEYFGFLMIDFEEQGHNYQYAKERVRKNEEKNKNIK